MGACCCGLPREKKIAATDFFDTFEHSLFLLHQSLRRSLHNASTASVQPRNTAPFLQYCHICLQFLIAHHVGEDRFLFPFMAEASGDASITQQESEEHQRLEKTINFIKTKLKNIDSNADNKTTEEAVAEIQSKFREIVEVLVGESGHLKREETKFTAQNMRSWGISEKKLREINSQLHAIIPDYLDKMEGLIFIIYHLNDEEKLFWDERIPCIVTKFKFPSKANQRKSMWSLAPYCRNNGREESKAKCTWHQG